MRALALHADVLVFTSQVWQTACTAVRGGDEGFLIDSPIYPDELEALPGMLEQAGFPVSGLLATHADWDHLLGCMAFPDAPLGCGESSARRLEREPGAAQRELRQFDEEYYVRRPRPLALRGIQELPIPGHLSLGVERELELYPAAGHTADGIAIWIPWARVLVCGDYLSSAEIPMISEGGSVAAYRATLERLRPLVEQAQSVVPGHGGFLPGKEAARVLGEDQAYLAALIRDVAAAELPPSRRNSTQAQIHAENVGRLGAAGRLG